MGYTAGALPHDMINNMGGSIGYSPPVATGAALACPDRRTICMTGDGSAMYTIQALWTQARERLNVVTVIFANRGYQILKAELVGVGAKDWGARAESMLSISNPDISWAKMAQGMGVEASRAETTTEFAAQFADAMQTRGPRLVEAVL